MTDDVVAVPSPRVSFKRLFLSSGNFALPVATTAILGLLTAVQFEPRALGTASALFDSGETVVFFVALLPLLFLHYFYFFVSSTGAFRTLFGLFFLICAFSFLFFLNTRVEAFVFLGLFLLLDWLLVRDFAERAHGAVRVGRALWLGFFLLLFAGSAAFAVMFGAAFSASSSAAFLFFLAASFITGFWVLQTFARAGLLALSAQRSLALALVITLCAGELFVMLSFLPLPSTTLAALLLLMQGAATRWCVDCVVGRKFRANPLPLMMWGIACTALAIFLFFSPRF